MSTVIVTAGVGYNSGYGQPQYGTTQQPSYSTQQPTAAYGQQQQAYTQQQTYGHDTYSTPGRQGTR